MMIFLNIIGFFGLLWFVYLRILDWMLDISAPFTSLKEVILMLIGAAWLLNRLWRSMIFSRHYKKKLKQLEEDRELNLRIKRIEVRERELGIAKREDNNENQITE